MKILFKLTFLILIFTSCVLTNSDKKTVQIVDLQELMNYLNKEDKLYIVNFWATWCKPCVEEIPYFIKLNEELEVKNVEIILVSLDFEEDLDKKVIPLLKKQNINLNVMLLNEGKPVYWIDKVNENWSGSIPATLLYHKKLEKSNYLGFGNFHEGELTFEQLKNWINRNRKAL